MFHLDPLATFSIHTDFCYQLLSRSTGAQTTSPDQRHFDSRFSLKSEHSCRATGYPRLKHVQEAASTPQGASMSIGSIRSQRKVQIFFLWLLYLISHYGWICHSVRHCEPKWSKYWDSQHSHHPNVAGKYSATICVTEYNFRTATWLIGWIFILTEE